jgi:hypothetical protein
MLTAKLQCEICVQLPNMKKTLFFFQTLGSRILQQTSDRQNKTCLRDAFPFSFFLFFYFLILNEDFRANLRCDCRFLFCHKMMQNPMKIDCAAFYC